MADPDDLFLEDGLEQDDSASVLWNGASSQQPQKTETGGGKGSKAGRGADTSGTRSGNSGKGNEGKGDKEKKTCRCEVCMKLFAPSAMAMNSPYCLEHKRVLDRISAMAKQQNQCEWWQEIRNHKDRTRFRQVVTRFCEQCPAGTPGRRNPYSVATLRTWYETKIAVAVVARGTMMNWERYEAWAKSADGGGLTKSEAQEKWKTWSDDAEVLRDQKGPSRDPLRLRVPTRDDVDLVSEYAQGTRQELHMKDVRKPDEKAIEKQRRQMFSVQGATHDQDMSGIGAGMLANLAGSTSMTASSGLFGTVTVADVTQLGVEAADVDEEDKDKNRGPKKKDRNSAGQTHDVDDMDEDDEGEEVTPVKVKPFDAELTLGKARRKADDTASGLEKQLQDAVIKADAALNKVSTMGTGEAAKYTHEVEALKYRLGIVAMVRDDKAQELKEALAAVANGTSPNPCGTSEQDKAWSAELVCVEAVRQYVSGYFVASSLDTHAAVCLQNLRSHSIPILTPICTMRCFLQLYSCISC